MKIRSLVRPFHALVPRRHRKRAADVDKTVPSSPLSSSSSRPTFTPAPVAPPLAERTLPAVAAMPKLPESLPVTAAEYEMQLREVSGERVPRSSRWQEVQDYCAAVLASMGYELTRHTYRTGTNIIATRLGTVRPHEEVWLSAHYDSRAGTPGADDNASGIAAVLCAASALAEGTPERTLKLALWDEEEDGLIGSRAYVREAYGRGDDIVASIVFEMIGYTGGASDQQFMWVLGNNDAQSTLQDYRAAAKDHGLTTRVWPQGWYRSDHVPFWEHGYPALLLFNGCDQRNPNYHRAGDLPETLNFGLAARVTNTAIQVAEALLQQASPPPRIVSTLTKSPQQALFAAVSAGEVGLVREALRQGANPMQNVRGCNALDQALDMAFSDTQVACKQQSSFTIVMELIAHGASVNHKHARYGSTPLLFAAQKGRTDIVHALLQRGADLLARSTSGYNALDFALEAPYLHTAVALIRAGMSVEHAHRKHTSTPLMFAGQQGDLEAIRALLALGANPHAENGRGMLAIDYARRAGKGAAVHLLEDAMQKAAPPVLLEAQRSRGPTAALCGAAAVRTCHNQQTLLLDPIDSVPPERYFETNDGYGFDIDELVQFMMSVRTYRHPYKGDALLSDADLIALHAHPLVDVATLERAMNPVPPRLKAATLQSVADLTRVLASDFNEAQANPAAAAAVQAFCQFIATLPTDERKALDAQYARGIGFAQMLQELAEGRVCLHWTAYAFYQALETHARHHGTPVDLRDLEALMARNRTHWR